jgi:hypothetical protein
MPLPSTGWLAIGSTGALEVLDLELPVPYIGTYKEGVSFANDPITKATDLSFDQLSIIDVLASCSIILGYSVIGARAFEVSLTRNGVYGFLLVDSFTPPLVTQEFFEFNAYTQLSCVGSTFFGTAPLYSACLDADDTSFVEDSSHVPTYEDA